MMILSRFPAVLRDSSMSDHASREVWILTLGALAAAPVTTGMGLIAMSGIIAW
jgi:hypothetical protein